MNDYTVSVNNNKHNLKILNNNKVELNGVILYVELSQLSKYSYLLKVNNRVYQVTSDKNNHENYSFTIAGYSYNVTVRTNLEEKANEYLKNKAKESNSEIIKSPMPGLIVKILKKVGDKVQMGEPIFLLEAMKMENEIRASASGIVKSISAKENSSVEKGEALLEIG
ncbi:MAG: acetyl-CoA carboxylase biotin carboxyl carrier protein subunit [Bacteroidetes bacterium]|nr:acetyl-CoA carboxylase biotin carboxyl carrier protein subunit [Bacteroidota bacterium]MBU1116005.1 acetyl-CoA carboxylase biotin carboxyl carrier protein subunit [Bacteroidota bacterium]MBU1799227.1 acetyl-CoA carboxylase biotin carboxyl carrier protein subunit [Bacteroidota bacterium]